TEANHSEPVPFFQFISDLRPRHDASRNCSRDLAHHNRDAWIFKSPRHRFVLLGTVQTARIETKSFLVLSVSDLAVDRRAIRVDVEDRQENSDAPRPCFENVVFIPFDYVHHSAIGSSHDYIRIQRHPALRLAEKS